MTCASCGRLRRGFGAIPRAHLDARGQARGNHASIGGRLGLARRRTLAYQDEALTVAVDRYSKGDISRSVEAMERNQNRNAILRSLVRDLPELVRGRSSHNQALDHRDSKRRKTCLNMKGWEQQKALRRISGVAKLPFQVCLKEVTMRQLLIVAAVGLIPTTGYAQAADYFRLQNDLKRSEMDAQQRTYEQEQRQREQLTRDQQRQREREIEQMRRRDEETLRSPRSFDFLGR
jgi:hypothetical protein